MEERVKDRWIGRQREKEGGREKMRDVDYKRERKKSE